jgi:hypothetical protein
VIPIVSGRVQIGKLLMLTRRYVHRRLVNKWQILRCAKGQYFDPGGGFKAKVKVALEADSDGPKSEDFSWNLHFLNCFIFPMNFVDFGVLEVSKSDILEPTPLYLSGLNDFQKTNLEGTRRVSAAVFEKYAFLACTCVVEAS